MVNTKVGDVLLICLLPVGTMLLGSIVVAYFQPGPKLTSAMQHFAAGIVLAAVSIELMPELALQIHGQNGVYTISMVLGFSSAVGILFLISRYFDADNDKEEKPTKEKNDADLKPDSITDVEMSQMRSTTPGMHLDINATADGDRHEHEMASPQFTPKHEQPSIQPQQPALQSQIPSPQPQSPPPPYTDVNIRSRDDSHPSHINHMVYAHEDSHSHSSRSNSYGMSRGIDGTMNYAPSPMMMNNGNVNGNGYNIRGNYPPPPPPPLPPAIPAPPMSISMNEAAHQYAYEHSNNGYEPSYSHHHDNQPQNWQGYPHHEFAPGQSSHHHGTGWDESHPTHHEYDPWNDHNWNTRQRYRPSISLSHSQHTWQPRVRYASQWKNHGRSDIQTPSTSRNRQEHSINSRNGPAKQAGNTPTPAAAVPVAAATMPYMMHGTASTSLAKSIARSTTRAALTEAPISTSASMNFKSSITTPGEIVVPAKTSWNVPWGLIVAVGVDGATDGILIGIASAVGAGGIIVAVALAIEMSFLGISTSIEMNELKVSRQLQIPLLIFLPLFIMAGGAIGATVMSDVSGPIFVGFLSFGMAALLFLVTEELLVSAHEDLAHDTWFVSLQFFAGFLLVAIMEQYSGGGDMCSERVAEAFARQGLPAPP